MSDPRIVFFTPTSFGGHALYTQELLTALAGSGAPYRFELVTSEDLPDALGSDRYPIHRVLPPMKHRRQFASRLHWAASRARHYLSRERAFLRWLEAEPEVGLVHLQEHSSWLGPWFVPAIRRLGVRVACTVHNLAPHLPLPFPLDWAESGFTRAALRRCDLLVTHTHGLERALEAHLGEASAERIEVVPHGLWRVDAPDRVEEEPRGRLLCFGTLRRNKGLDVAVDALRFLPEATLTLAGPPEDEACAAALAAQIAQSPDRARIHTRFAFIPEPEVSALFRDADLVLLPYRDFAAQSGVLHLALAHGVPVVVTDVGGLGELVREHAVGRVAPTLGPEALAHQVREALWPPRHLALRRNVAAAREALSWERAALRLAALYRRTLSPPEVGREGEALPVQERA